MKKIMTALLFLSCIACTSDKKENSSETVQAVQVGSYGETISIEGAISTQDMIAELGERDSVSIKVKSEIVTTCSNKGCWMNLVMPNGEEMRVTFKDYGFFVPKEGMEGNEAVIEGTLMRTVTDVETLRHFAEDAGKSETEIAGITTPKEELTFVASGVVILESTED